MSSPRPDWLSPGLVLSSVQEPLTFIVRRGAALGDLPADLETRHEQRRSEPAVKELVESGVTLSVTNGHKAFGFETERRDIQSSVRYARLCHKHGIRVGAYIGETLGFETLFLETPEARDWVARRYDGKRIFWLGQTFRLVACKFHQGWIDFQKRAVEIAIRTIGVDFLHFDNVYVMPEPDSCHCPACQEKFRRFLRAKYTPDELRRRLGFSNIDGVVPPPFAVESCGTPPDELERIGDPLQQEWVDFRCDQLARMFAQLCDHARALKPDVVLECNPVCPLINYAWLRGVDMPRIIRHCDYFWVEDGNSARLEPDGRLVSNIRTHKLARTFNAAVFARTTSADPRESCLRTAEAMAFNRDCIGPLPGRTGHPANAYVQFFRARRELYHDTTTLADAAVLRSFKSLAWDSVRTHLSVLLTEQTLIQNRVPFHILYDEHVRDAAPYGVLVLPDVEFMSDAESARIERLVRGGLNVLATDLTGCYDEMGRRRRTSILLDRLGLDVSAHEAGVVKAEIGPARVAWLPKIEPRRPMPEPGYYRQIDNRYWRLPANAAEILDALRWCLGRPFTLLIDAGPNVVAEIALSAARDAVLVHIVNFDIRTPAEGLTVDVALPAGRDAADVTLYEPATGEPVRAPFECADGRVSFRVPMLDIYVVARIALR